MTTVAGLDDLQMASPSVATVGVFDGVHVGHQAIMRIVKADAAEMGARAVAVTFEGSPAELVCPAKSLPCISTLSQKLRLLEDQGMDLVLVLPLDPSLLEMSAEQFVREVLVGKLGVVQVVVGSSFVFGKGRAGNVELLRDMGKRHGFEVVAVSPIKVDGVLVSSTAIRRLLLSGNIERANVLLGRPFVLQGRVVEGEGMGTELGFPTANLEPPPGQIVPAQGVYAASARVGESEMPSVVNIGTRPTVGGTRPVIEMHIIGFTGDLYGQDVESVFHRRLRDEIRFSDTDALKAQIALDIEHACRLLK